MNVSYILKFVFWKDCDINKKKMLLSRPSIKDIKNISIDVSNILKKVKEEGDKALYILNYNFSKIKISKLQISEKKINESIKRVTTDIKKAIKIAANNIKNFHKTQQLNPIKIETEPLGINCYQITRAISSIGLYIPGGLAKLFSTVLMLAIPAQVAKCKQVILCSPPPISDEIIYTAKLCGINQIFQIGGAQAIAAMAFGTKSIPKVNKIFGPGNIWVTEAKRQVSEKINGTTIDLPAGPSEVLIIADDTANPIFTAADFLSQLEHGINSQSILTTPSYNLAVKVLQEIEKQFKIATNINIIKESLNNSRIIITNNLYECIAISNYYAPEHLIMQINNAENYLEYIINAGTIFLGNWSSITIGDYISGSNHVLPTYGYAKTHSGLNLADFQKRITIQKTNFEGLSKFAPTIEILTQAEKMFAHKNSIKLRIDYNK